MVSFGTKAETLEAIRPRLERARILPSVIFTVREWESDSSNLLKKVMKHFPATKVIVRSSAFNEDSAISAMAGMHDSIADVDANNQQALRAAIDSVIASYLKSGGHHALNQVFIQPMVSDVSMSGVIFTQDLNTGAPYYVINYDDVSGKTDTITSGYGDCNRTLLIHRGHVTRIESTRFRSLLAAVVEIEALLPAEGLDIEFAVTKSEEICIFQVRRLTIYSNWNRSTVRKVDLALQQLSSFLESRLRPRDGVLGERSIFGEMSDWNPAEMIGANPRRLAYSLYKSLITDSVWAEARAEMGYRDLSGRSLMVNLCGRPYIDVRESFNSFLPSALSDEVSAKLVNTWLRCLDRAPELHDKIEFEVATTAYTPDFNRHVQPRLLDSKLTSEDIDQFAVALRALTNKIISGVPNLMNVQLEAIQHLASRREANVAADKQPQEPLLAVKSLLDDVRNFGTKPFSVLARCAFIAEDYLRWMKRSELLSDSQVVQFRQSVRTVLSEFLDEVRDCQQGQGDCRALLERFGHLRPGTYDILAKRYDQRTDLFSFARSSGSGHSTPASNGRSVEPVATFQLSAAQQSQIDSALQAGGMTFDCQSLFIFMREAIMGREFAKLSFTKNVSDTLELIADWGSKVGISREELSHISIEDILLVNTEALQRPLEDHFREISKEGEEAHEVSQAIRLPFLITEISDIHVVPLLKSRPNFITSKSVDGPVTVLGGDDVRPNDLDSKIIAIEGADPGYDWIFMCSIAGLVTKYGGANSHMAIRCAELGIPAAIGCGEQIFDLVQNAAEISMDCGTGMIVPIA